MQNVIKPVNTVVARMTYEPTQDCANGSLATGSRDSVNLTIWEYGASDFDPIFECSQASTLYFQSFKNDVFCEAVIRFTQNVENLDGQLDLMSIGGLDAIDTESPTLTSIQSIAAGRPTGGTFNTSTPTREGGCQHFLRYSSIARQVDL